MAQDHKKWLEKDRSFELRAEDAVDDEDEHETLPGLTLAEREEPAADEEREDLEGGEGGEGETRVE